MIPDKFQFSLSHTPRGNKSKTSEMPSRLDFSDFGKDNQSEEILVKKTVTMFYYRILLLGLHTSVSLRLLTNFLINNFVMTFICNLIHIIETGSLGINLNNQFLVCFQHFSSEPRPPAWGEQQLL